MNIENETNEKSSSSSIQHNINVICPHCNEKYIVSDLMQNLLEQSLNYHIYACSKCRESLKIDPFEYLWVKNNMEADNFANDVDLPTYKLNELTLSQREALESSGILTRIRAFLSGIR